MDYKNYVFFSCLRSNIWILQKNIVPTALIFFYYKKNEMK
jgi:hypothetical protein